MRLHLGQTGEAGITVAMQLLGIGKAALHRFLAPGIKPFAQIGQPIGVDRLLEFFPEVPGEQLLMIPTLRALRPLRAVSAAGRVRGVLPVAQTVGRAVRQHLAGRAVVAILLGVIAIVALVEIAIAMVRPLVAHHPEQFSVNDAFAHLWGEVAGIQPDGTDRQIKALPDAIESGQVRLAVMDIARRHMRVDNQGMYAVD